MTNIYIPDEPLQFLRVPRFPFRSFCFLGHQLHKIKICLYCLTETRTARFDLPFAHVDGQNVVCFLAATLPACWE